MAPDETVVVLLFRCAPMTRLTVLGAVATFLDAHAADADGFRGAEVLCTADEQAVVATVRWADEAAWAGFARRPEVQRAATAVAAHAPEVLVAEPAHRTVPRPRGEDSPRSSAALGE